MVTKMREAAGATTMPVKRKTRVGVLIVDDDATKRFALRTILSPLDEDIVEASSGADALRQLLRSEFAVVLLDVRMPIMDGFETAQLIRQRPRSEVTPIVFAPVVPAIMRAKVGVFVELYRAQQELRRYRTQLETLVEERTIALTAINRELEAFSYAVSHDLRAPLKQFDGLSKTLLENNGKLLDKRTTANLKKMREASERMMDVSALSGQLIGELQAASPARKVEVEIAPGVILSGDRRLVRILLANLINNAWKFSGSKKPARISVGSEVVEGETRVFVKDNGVGFDMIDSHRLFGAFQRLHSQSEFAGAGIGLATARRIVNRHGGRIWAEGAVGDGATFYFVI